MDIELLVTMDVFCISVINIVLVLVVDWTVSNELVGAFVEMLISRTQVADL